MSLRRTRRRKKRRRSLHLIIILLDAHVEHVHLLIGVHSTHVRPDVRRVPRAIRAIRTIESRQLPALEFQVIVQIILSRERVTAFLTRIILLLLVSNEFVVARLPMRETMITRMRYRPMNTCEQKCEPNDDFLFAEYLASPASRLSLAPLFSFSGFTLDRSKLRHQLRTTSITLLRIAYTYISIYA